MLPKNSNMSKIRILIYILDVYNLQTRTVTFHDYKKLLKKVDSGQTCACTMNANTKNSQMEHWPCPKYGVYRPDLYSLQVRKTSEKRARGKIHGSKYATTE